VHCSWTNGVNGAPSAVWYTVQYCTVPYCSVPYCTVLYCTVLWCTSTATSKLPAWYHPYRKSPNTELEKLWYCRLCYGIAYDVMVWQRMLWYSLRRNGMAEGDVVQLMTLWYGRGCYGIVCDFMVRQRMFWCDIGCYGVVCDVMVRQRMLWCGLRCYGAK
jgi:hypothetical protein